MTTVSWSGSRWHVESDQDDFARLTRVRDGPSTLQRKGDSVLVARSLLD